MVPFYGQGMNAGFEDCILLDQLHDLYGSADRNQVFAEFSKIRQPDANAICDLALYNYWEMSAGVIDKFFQMKQKLHAVLHRLFPSRWLPLYTMVSFTRISYSQVVRRQRRQDVILGSGLLATAAATLVFTALVMRRMLRNN